VKHTRLLFCSLIMVLSCQKDQIMEPIDENAPLSGLYVGYYFLTEGNFPISLEIQQRQNELQGSIFSFAEPAGKFTGNLSGDSILVTAEVFENMTTGIVYVRGDTLIGWMTYPVTGVDWSIVVIKKEAPVDSLRHGEFTLSHIISDADTLLCMSNFPDVSANLNFKASGAIGRGFSMPGFSSGGYLGYELKHGMIYLLGLSHEKLDILPYLYDPLKNQLVIISYRNAVIDEVQTTFIKRYIYNPFYEVYYLR